MLIGKKKQTSIIAQQPRVGTIKPFESKNQGLYIIPYHLFIFIELIHNHKLMKKIFTRMLILNGEFIGKKFNI